MAHEIITKAIKANDGDFWLNNKYFGDTWGDYKHDQVTKVYVNYYEGNERYPGDCWIAAYYLDDKYPSFYENYDSLEDFWKLNECFSKEIIEIEEVIA